MKKRILSLILTISIIFTTFSLFNTTAFAVTVSRDWLWPVPASNRISSCFGDGRNHNAIDIAAPQGSDIIASMGGTVVKTFTGCTHNYPKSGNCPCSACLNLGNYVYIQHTYAGKSYISRYGHLTDVYVSVGDTVKAGDVIGTVGCTGRSTGFHLDFQIYEGTLSSRVKYIDPLKSPFLQPISGLNANAASTACCYTYVSEVYKILSTESAYKDGCTVVSYENTYAFVTSSASVMSQPCTAATFEYSYELDTVEKDEELTVYEMITNTVGEIWIYVKTESGTVGYIKADSAYVMTVSNGYSKYTTDSAILAYYAPYYSSSAKTYPSGSVITIIGSIKDLQGMIWYLTKDNEYIPYSSVGEISYISSLYITGTPYPYNKLELGKSHSISGTVKSYNEISCISVVIKNESDMDVLSKTVNCGSTFYSFRGSELDYAIPFSTLPEGIYTYELKITETSHSPDGKDTSFVTTLVNEFAIGTDFTTVSIKASDPNGEVKEFSPEAPYSTLSKYDKLSISGFNSPSTLQLGNPFSIYGTVSSDESSISSVTVCILDSSGNPVISASAAPNSMTYDIHKLDSSLKFGSLATGKYTYIIKAINDCGETTLLSKEFSVVDKNEETPVSGSFDNFIKIREYCDKFKDVDVESWYRINIETAYSLGIINGESETLFLPDSYLTIAECITLAANMHKIYYCTDHEFILGEIWYEDYVQYALDNGIISSGFPDYNAYATRSQVAEMFANVFPDGALTEINTVNVIPDVSLNDKYSDSVFALYKSGILMGSDELGTFNPDSNILRCEIAAIVSRIAIPSIRLNFSL